MSEPARSTDVASDDLKPWPCEFLGRCQHCLDNAYLNKECVELRHNDCLIRRARITRAPITEAVGRPFALEEALENLADADLEIVEAYIESLGTKLAISEQRVAELTAERDEFRSCLATQCGKTLVAENEHARMWAECKDLSKQGWSALSDARLFIEAGHASDIWEAKQCIDLAQASFADTIIASEHRADVLAERVAALEALLARVHGWIANSAFDDADLDVAVSVDVLVLAALYPADIKAK